MSGRSSQRASLAVDRVPRVMKHGKSVAPFACGMTTSLSMRTKLALISNASPATLRQRLEQSWRRDEHPHLAIVQVGLHSVAVELDLMDPASAGRYALDPANDRGLNEAWVT
jgi:hypothetical protein